MKSTMESSRVNHVNSKPEFTYTLNLSQLTTPVSTTPLNGNIPSIQNITTPSSARIQNGTTTMLSLTPRHKLIKTKSISSISKAFRTRKWKWRPRRKRGSISASFNMNDKDFKVEFINVNRATEEELMTLPGINRTLARNIVNHRTLIGGYKRIDDLALVSGMGATKLDQIRNEICISQRKHLSEHSSKSPSLESIGSSSSSNRTSRSPKNINLNTATIFELMTIDGINQALAAKIINYRDKKGQFKNIEDLRHVGITYKRLGALQNLLCVDVCPELDRTSIQSQITPSASPGQIQGHRRSSSAPIVIKPTLFSFDFDVDETEEPIVDTMREIFELMSLKSQRPTHDCEFSNKIHNFPAYRLASWNMEGLNLSKVTNPGVLEVITRTILENGISILAVQEVSEELALQNICDELNEPRLSRNKSWRKPRGIWKYVMKNISTNHSKFPSGLAVLYNKEKIESVTIPVTSLEFSPIQNGNLWQFAPFTVTLKSNSFILLNVLSQPLSQYTNGTGGRGDPHPINTGDLIECLVKEINGDGCILVGSFNSQSVQKGMECLKNMKNISSPDENNNGGVWITKGIQSFYTGESGVIIDGLSHLAIPNGWSWGGRVTKCSPLWSNFYEEPNNIQN